MIPLDEASLARASVFARADHPALQPVLRVDRQAGEIWLGALRGAALSRSLTAAEAATLRDALARLHELGAVHGSVDAAHVMVDEAGGVVLAMGPGPGAAPGPARGDGGALATADLDRIALARLT